MSSLIATSYSKHPHDHVNTISHTQNERKTSCRLGGVNRQLGQSPQQKHNYQYSSYKRHHIIVSVLVLQHVDVMVQKVCVCVCMACHTCHSTQTEAQAGDTGGRGITHDSQHFIESACAQRHDMR